MSRRYRLHVPAQYTGAEPAALMVFQDGSLYLDPDGDIRAGSVFDELIERGEMPVTIGVFVDPGEDRNLEYDAFSDAYASFLLTEILPGVLDNYNVTDDPEQWAIGGGSSGGSCAFTAAWTRPDRFRRVLLPRQLRVASGRQSLFRADRARAGQATAHLSPRGDQRSQLGSRPELACRESAGRRRPGRARLRLPARSHRPQPRTRGDGRDPGGRAPVALAPLGSRTDGEVPPLRVEAERLRAA